LDQINAILDRLGYKDQVYSVLHQDQQQAEETPTIYGMGPTLIEEYQTKLQDLRKDLDSKDLMVKSLQNDSESLLKSSEEDQKVMKN
jgi:hypothetical protein